ncbi:IS1182 family transposase [Candidatus Peregrinibacteria bacterium]|nr:IS1182 family transposase [Candidatus Peregrinibacteria bacterium]
MAKTQILLFPESDIKLRSPHVHTAAIETLPLSNPAPRLKYVDRDQLLFRAVRIDKLIDDKHPARAIWEFTEHLDLTAFYENIEAVEGVAGRRATDPRLLISLWIYALSQGVGSARKIAELCEYHPAFQWLAGTEEINHHTISDFRVDHKEALEKLFVQILGILSAEGLVTLERVAHDGTKIKAYAGIDSFRREEKIRAHLAMAQDQLEILKEEDLGTSHERNSVKTRERFIRDRKNRMERALEELEKIRSSSPEGKAKDKVRASTTDPEARIMKQPDGGFAPSYNVQISADADNGVIVGMDVTQAVNDCDQLTPAMEEIKRNTGFLPDQVVADGGFTNRQSILDMDEKGIDFIGSVTDTSSQSKARLKSRGIDPEFYPEKFKHDSASNTYTCPAGKVLRYMGKVPMAGVTEHRYAARADDCANCPNKAKCCPKSPSKGRGIVRRENAPEVKAFLSKMQTPEAKEAYCKRGPIAEFPYAWIKEKMHLRQFRLQGLIKVNMECLWACLTYNIQQWIRLRWREPGVQLGI